MMAVAGLFIFGIACKHEAAPPATVYFPQVKQIIQANCISCHSPGGQGLPVILTTDENIVALSASIKAAVIDPINPRNRRMPLGSELSDADKTVIQKWFDKGGTATD